MRPAGRWRRAGARAASGGRRSNSAEIVRDTKGGRHAARQHGAARGLYRSRPSPLVDVEMGPVSARQSMIRATQTRAFGATVIVGVALTWLGAVVPLYLDGASSPPLPPSRLASDSPTPAAPPFSLKEHLSHATPGTGGATPSVSIDPHAFAQLEMALAKLDQDADGSEVLAPQQPLPAATCEPTCTDATPTDPLPEQDVAPGLPQELNPPPASATVDQSIPSPGDQSPLATDPASVPTGEQPPLVQVPDVPATGPAVVPPAAGQTLGPPPGPS